MSTNTHLTKNEQKMHAAALLLPPPGDEVVFSLLNTIDLLRGKLAEIAKGGNALYAENRVSEMVKLAKEALEIDTPLVVTAEPPESKEGVG
jgi:hypothetical protein